MDKIFWIEQGKLCGRPGPEEAPWDISELLSGGITTIISLDQDNVDHQSIVDSGIHHVSFALPDSIPPTESDAELWQNILPLALSAINEGMARDGAVMVHCHAGKDRTGVLLGSYLTLVKGMDPLKAFKNVRKCRPVAMTSTGYEDFFLGLMQKMLEKRHLFKINNQQSS